LYAQNPASLKNRVDPEIYEALVSNNQVNLEKLVGKKVKEYIDKQKADQERILKLQNADPNDVEAQKQIEEEIRKSVIESNYQTALENCPEFFG
jgi:hypothetical protein